MSKLTMKQRDAIEQLAKMSDSDVDISDIPEITHWDQAKIGRFKLDTNKSSKLDKSDLSKN